MMQYENHLLQTVVKAGVRPQGRKLRRAERKTQRLVDAQFDVQVKYITKKYKKILNKKDFKALDEDVDLIFGDKFPDKTMINEILVVSAATMKLGADYRIRASRLSKIGISFNLKHPLAIDYLTNTRPLILSAMKETTKEHIKPLLIEGISTGASPQSLAKTISQNYAFSKDRSLMIAVNEMGTAYEEGNFIPMVDVEAKGFDAIKKWLTVNDPRVTVECHNNQAMGWIKLRKDFSSNDEKAPRHSNPRCRCTTLYDYN